MIVLTLWWGPILLALIALSKWRVFELVGSGWGFLIGGVILFGWSTFIMRFVVHTRVEPFFNIRSMQNRREHLFKNEPVNSFRDWLRLMFLGRR